MTAHFQEFLVNNGVDLTGHPPVMMIPLPADGKHSGSNFVLLVGGDGYALSTSHKRLKVADFDPRMYNILANVPFIGSVLPRQPLLSNRRLLQISCDVTLGKQGGKVHAKSKTRPSQVITIDVVPLRQRKVKLAIVQVQLPDKTMLSRKPADAKVLCDALNTVWTPQANVFFELVKESPVAVDLPTDEGFRLQPDKYLASFTKARPSGVDFTIFLVRNIGTASGNSWSVANGRTHAEQAMAFVADYGRGLGDGERTIAHEAGHWLGAFDAKGNFIRFPDHLEMRPTHLMTQGGDGGNGLKIPLRETGEPDSDPGRRKGTLERFNWNYN